MYMGRWFKDPSSGGLEPWFKQPSCPNKELLYNAHDVPHCMICLHSMYIYTGNMSPFCAATWRRDIFFRWQRHRDTYVWF